ncbi:cyclin H [Striga asiatica]|uniref:Cyclin H n=1 Tax=Striga asiatica TaxID=4170 RepID=A0A5A7RJZ8_STRAF|nr:cyclin H [Striga asiatica]
MKATYGKLVSIRIKVAMSGIAYLACHSNQSSIPYRTEFSILHAKRDGTSSTDKYHVDLHICCSCKTQENRMSADKLEKGIKQDHMIHNYVKFLAQDLTLLFTN